MLPGVRIHVRTGVRRVRSGEFCQFPCNLGYVRVHSRALSASCALVVVRFVFQSIPVRPVGALDPFPSAQGLVRVRSS